MKTLEESIAIAMDMQDAAIVPFLPYILQDFWELGTSSEVVVNLVRKHCGSTPLTNLQVLDLGCGKGAVSVKLAATLNCNCLGIDGMAEFIETAKEKAQAYNVEALCRFEVGDIREKIKTLGKFDVIVLGGIGQVFGDYYTTFTTLTQHLAPNGIIIIDDAYIDDSSSFRHPAILPRRDIMEQTERAGMELIDKQTDWETAYSEEFENLKRRCNELIAKYPEKHILFENYIQTEADEYDVLENEVVALVMVFRRKI